MQRLILFRHAKAERRADSGEDFDRDLTDRGLHDARLMGEALAQRGFAPDLALVSGAQRTRTTWAALSGAFPKSRVAFDDDLYNAAPEDLMAAALACGEAGTVLIVAHNPGLHEASVKLILRGEASDADRRAAGQGMPTATAAVFDLSGSAPRLEAWLLARDFGGGAGE